MPLTGYGLCFEVVFQKKSNGPQTVSRICKPRHWRRPTPGVGGREADPQPEWEQAVKKMRGKGQRMKGDERILGDSDFVDAVLTDTRMHSNAKRKSIARAMILNGWSGVRPICWIWNRMKS
jgi:hypothetical protein